MKKRSVLFLLVAILIVAVIFLKPQEWFAKSASSAPVKASLGPGAINVQAVVVTPELVENKIFATGTVMPNEQVELRSEISGRVVGLYFKEDAPVSQGQLLVKINDSDYKAQLKKIRVQEKLAAEDEARKSKLLEVKGISQEEYDRALSLVNSLKADADLLESQIAKTEIRAPFNGVIGLRHISEGGYISPNTLVASLQQLNPVKIEFTIPEKYSDLVKKGSKIIFSVTGKETRYTGTVYAAASQIDFNTRTLTVRAMAQNPDRSLMPGAFVKIEFILEDIQNALLVPTEAIIPELGGQKVFVVRNNAATSVKVETGLRTDKEIQITKGLSSSDTVIITGLLQVREKTPVQVNKIVTKEMLSATSKTN